MSTQPIITEPLIDVDEAANYAKLHPKTLQRLARENVIRAYAILGTQRKRWRFRKSDIDAWANSCVNSSSDSRRKGK